ncbi:MAG: hypothetical protein LBF22_12760 [Deltaproteobacteria bacterium]|jgi:hypothetical protein|nr:hypothetical protein [Deltaproteobacteria bacterium]
MREPPDNLKLISQSHYTRVEKTVGIILFFAFLLVIAGALIIGAGRTFFREYNHYFIIFHSGYGLIP